MEKQIEEMAKDICEYNLKGVCALDGKKCDLKCERGKMFNRVYTAGYRKQAEGEWKFEHDPINDPKKYFIRIVCSCCGLKTGQVSNFCPNCGAKMKGGAE